MRLVGSIGLLASLALAPRIALAKGDHHSGPVVHDHRSSSSSDSGHSGPVVRDHRSSDAGPVVRDHRSSDSAPVVRDHRYGSTGAYYESDDVIVDDAPSSGGFMNPHGPSWTLEIGGLARRFTGPTLSRTGTVETTSGDSASYGIDSGAPSAGDTASGAFRDAHHRASFRAPVCRCRARARRPHALADPAHDDRSDLQLSRAMVGATAVVGARPSRYRRARRRARGRHARAVDDGAVGRRRRGRCPSATETSLTGLIEARFVARCGSRRTCSSPRRRVSTCSIGTT